MPRQKLDNYLKTNRLRWGLSQQELGKLFDICKDAVSKCELGKRTPSVNVLLTSEMIFGLPPDKLFPVLYKSLQDKLGARALALHTRLARRMDKASLRKRALLEGIPGRTKNIPDV